MQEAINSVADNGTATIEILGDLANGSGFEIPDSKANKNMNITIDFKNYTYNVSNGLVGSTNTKNQAMHFAKGNTLTLKNGTITVSENLALIMMQNYCDLTLDNMNIDCSNVKAAYYDDPSYQAYSEWYQKRRPVFNYNAGSHGSTITNNSIVTFADGDEFGVIVDDGVNITIEELSVINGNVSVLKGAVTLDEATVNGNITVTPNEGSVTETNQPQAVAKIGDDNYPTLETAFKAATTGQTISLLADATVTNTISVTDGRTITLDLNGKKVLSSIGTTFKLEKGTLNVGNGTITVSGEAFRVSGTTDAASNTVLNLANNLDVTSSGDCCVFILKKATLNTQANLTSTGQYSTIQGNGLAKNDGTVINITGGSVTHPSDNAIYVPQKNTMTVSGGTITGATAIYCKSGTLTISDDAQINGTGEKKDYIFHGDGAHATGDALVIDNCDYPGGVPTVSVTGGTFTSTNAAPVASYTKDESIAPVTGFVTGGIFDEPIPVELCGTNLIPVEYDVESGTYTVDHGTVIADGPNATYTSAQATADPTNVVYTRTFGDNVANNYQCWFVPFEYVITQADIDAGIRFYDFDGTANGIDAGCSIGIIEMGAGDPLGANQVYVIKAPKGSYEFLRSGTRLMEPAVNSWHRQFTGGGYTIEITGTYALTTATADDEWATLNVLGYLFWADAGDTVRPFRWYIKATETATGNPARNIMFNIDNEGDGTTTGIEAATVSTDSEVEAIYSANGQRLSAPVKGLNIIRMKDNSVKKVIIK